jgi:hypothetical protein
MKTATALRIAAVSLSALVLAGCVETTSGYYDGDVYRVVEDDFYDEPPPRRRVRPIYVDERRQERRPRDFSPPVRRAEPRPPRARIDFDDDAPIARPVRRVPRQIGSTYVVPNDGGGGDCRIVRQRAVTDDGVAVVREVRRCD